MVTLNWLLKKVAQGAHADLISIDNEGNITEQEWENWTQPMPLSSVLPPIWAVRHGNSRNLLMPVPKRGLHVNGRIKSSGGFTNSASLNGDKQVTLIYLQTLASQHGGLWVSLGQAPANVLASTREDVNNLGGSVGLLVQSPADAGADQIPTGDLDTAVKYGERVATITVRLK